MKEYKFLEIILEEDPFTFKYDLKKMNKILKENDLTQSECDTIDFLNSCSKLFKYSYKKIIEVYKEFKSEEQILDFLFENLNEQYLIAQKSILNNPREANTYILNVEQVQFTKFQNPGGPNVNAKDILERGGDILNILIKFLKTFKGYKEATKTDSVNKINQKQSFFELWFYASNIYSFNSFCDIIRYEKGMVKLFEKKTEINSTDEFKVIRTLVTVGEIRKRNHIHELSNYANFYKNAFSKNALDRKKITKYDVTNGYVNNLITNIVKYSDEESIDLAKYLKTSKYLENLNFDFYGNISLKDIIEIFIQIEHLVNMMSKSNFSENISKTGYKVNKKTLLDLIVSTTNLEVGTIIKIINALTEKNESPYFWRRPLYELNGDVYLSYSLLNAPNFDLLLESVIIEANISISEQISYFKEEIINELSDISEKYTFRQAQIQGNTFESNIVYELQDYFLVIEVVILEKFPIESEDIMDSISKLNCIAQGIKDKLLEISILVDGKKPFVPIIVTNYNCFSSLILNKIPIFDETLLKNYFTTGNFRKAQTLLTTKHKTSKIFNQFNYYENEDEFNAHFLNFIINPVPIVEIQNKLFWQKIQVFSEDIQHQIYIDVCDYIDDNTNIENKIVSLNTSLIHQYHNKIDESENNLYDVSIQFQLTDIFYLLAYGKYDFSFYRFQLSKIFQGINIRGYSHLIFYFRNALVNLNTFKIKKDKTFNSVKYDDETISELIDKIIEENGVIKISDFKINLSLNKAEEKQIISFALNLISTITVKKYEEREIEFYFLLLAFLKNFNKKYDLNDEFYSAGTNLITALNFNNNYQTARNLAEDILVVSIEERKIYKGWETLFVCLEQQRNIFDASIYGCLYMTSLSVETQLAYSEVINVFFNILKFSRNIYSKEILENVFNLLTTYKLKEYDEQKIHLSYYLSILLDTVTEKEKIEKSLSYFKQKIKRIIFYKEKGIVPWLNYFYNIKRLQEEGILDESIDVDELIDALEKEISPDYFLSIKQKHFSNENLKDNFIKSVRSSLHTYSYSDYVFENQNLDLDAELLINDGILKNDVESILLSGFITNDIRLIYNNRLIEANSVVQLNLGQSDYEHLNNYTEHILDKISLHDNQAILYLFTSRSSVYLLFINSSKQSKIMKVDNWTLKKMNYWLKNTDEFYFDSNKYYDLWKQEESYEKLLEQLDFTNLDIEFEVEEILISTNIDLSKFPLNLIVNKGEFLGSKMRISNILLLEWYLSNNKEIVLNSNYTSTCWAPINEGDPAISYGYEKLRPVLEKNNIKQITESFPEEINSDINIFFAHGELNGSGFKAVYKTVENDSVVISNKKLFGVGKIAILFICHSGKIDKNFFSNSAISLIHEIMELGYSAVIAPCWSLEVTIPHFWLNEFLIKFNSGSNVNEAVYYANKELAEYKESISNSYFVPEGRLAMHLYGNPNIRIDKVKNIEI